LGLLVSPLRAAEPPSFSSAEAIKDKIDAAMPGLLKRDMGTVQGLLKSLVAADKIETLMPIFCANLKLDHPPNELSWKFLGTKKVGSIFRQFVYICQYDRGCIVWRFSVSERENHWSLANLNCGGLPDDIMEEKPASDTQCEQLSDRIAGMVANGDRDLIDLAKVRFVALDGATDVEPNARKWATYSMIGGRLLKCERTRSRSVEDILAEYQYLIQWKNGTLIITVAFYHVGSQWRLVYFKAGEPDDLLLFANVALDPQTRQAAKPDDKRLK
jgi:hypothetical protein